MRIDHIVWGARDLPSACAAFEKMTGVTPRFGGVHGHGRSHNAIVGLGPRCYLEIFAPTPGTTTGDDWIEFCLALEAPRLFAVCIDASGALDRVAASLRGNGLDGDGPAPWQRTKPDGTVLHWRLFDPDPKPYGKAMPFFIDWGATPHPSQGAPGALQLNRLDIATPHASPVRNLLNAAGVDCLAFEQAPIFAMTAQLLGPTGPVELR